MLGREERPFLKRLFTLEEWGTDYVS